MKGALFWLCGSEKKLSAFDRAPIEVPSVLVLSLLVPSVL